MQQRFQKRDYGQAGFGWIRLPEDPKERGGGICSRLQGGPDSTWNWTGTWKVWGCFPFTKPTNFPIIDNLILTEPNLSADYFSLGDSLGPETARFSIFSLSGPSMAPRSDALRDVNRRWVRRVTNGGKPDFNPRFRTNVKYANVLGIRDRVPYATVDVRSAA